ncbi:MAG: TlpA family protein disulfide reductase [Methanomassiliicoccales archaeon]|nr:MAG: TlpA family protein disulfide reductase [Methanomassiliicoccales archaeon]
MAKMRECPVCGIHVKTENLESHLKRVHPRAKVDVSLTEDDKTAIKIARKEERKRMAPFEERERKKWILAGIIVSVLIVTMVILLSSFGPIGSGCDLVGEDAIYFRRGDVEGNEIDLNDLIEQKELIVLEFFYTECGACQAMASTMHDLHEHYNYGEEVVFIAISSSSRDSVQKVRDFRDTYGGGGNMTYIWDSSFSVSGDYCVQVTPTYVIIDDQGIIVDYFTELRTFDYMVAKIESHLQG